MALKLLYHIMGMHLQKHYIENQLAGQQDTKRVVWFCFCFVQSFLVFSWIVDKGRVSFLISRLL